MGQNRPAQDLNEVITLALEDVDRAARVSGITLPLAVRICIINWLARAHDGGRLLPREPREPGERAPR